MNTGIYIELTTTNLRSHSLEKKRNKLDSVLYPNSKPVQTPIVFMFLVSYKYAIYYLITSS